jgi:hypothetical protein
LPKAFFYASFATPRQLSRLAQHAEIFLPISFIFAAAPDTPMTPVSKLLIFD